MSASIDSDAVLLALMEPDGYYRYLGVTKPSTDDRPSESASPANGTTAATAAAATATGVDEDSIKKNYRKLSLKHHPDKGGDPDTFRLLNRAYRVLINPNLRKQYDILGIDLDDDEEEADHQDGSKPDGDDSKETSATQRIIQEIGSNVLQAVLTFGVRTLMMATVSVVIVRFRVTLYPALAFMAYICFKTLQKQRSPGGSIFDTIPPTLIAIGLLIMSNARDSSLNWNTQFWMGEALVIGLFLYNSLSFLNLANTFVMAAIVGVSLLSALFFRGKFWNYAALLGLVVFFGLIVALGFPIMEMLLESILNEKLRRVGDRVRHHHQLLQAHYAKKNRR